MENCHILIIEDNFSLLRLYTNALKQAGHTVHHLPKASDAYGRLLNSRYHLCISTIDDHVGSVTTLVLMLNAMCRRQGTRLLLTSAEESFSKLCRKLQVEFYLKPIATEDLLQLVEAGANHG